MVISDLIAWLKALNDNNVSKAQMNIFTIILQLHYNFLFILHYISSYRNIGYA